MIITVMHSERPEGTVIATNLMAQYDLVMPDPRQDLGGERDLLRYDVYLDWVAGIDVRRRDVLVDDRTIDPLTGSNVRLRVTGVEVFDQDHVEARCEQVMGR